MVGSSVNSGGRALRAGRLITVTVCVLLSAGNARAQQTDGDLLTTQIGETGQPAARPLGAAVRPDDSPGLLPARGGIAGSDSAPCVSIRRWLCTYRSVSVFDRRRVSMASANNQPRSTRHRVVGAVL